MAEQVIREIFLLSILNVVIWILFHKFGAISQYQLHRAKWMPVDCNFCFFFWTGFILWMVLDVHGKVFLWERVREAFLLALMASVLSLFFKPKTL